MNKREIDEDALDSEAIQAQIDLSMSFAQGLVSSWMEPNKFSSSSQKKDLEKELTDYMRRPPRLGVGASVPEGHQSTSREIARLKGKLSRKKRTREDEEVAAMKQPSDEEGGSRAGAIKKRARPDPFDVVHGKKKKKRKLAEPIPPLSTSPTRAASQSKGDTLNAVEETASVSKELPKLNGINTATTSSVKSKKKKKKAAQILKEASPDATDVHDTHFSGSPVAEKSVPPRDTPLTPKFTSGKYITGSEPLDASLVPTPWGSIANRKSLPLALVDVPLLNLNGPPSDPESGVEHAVTMSPKKKRKRRKKKKIHLTPNTTSMITAPQ
ncbi:hypothetical protein BDN70DRAFT_422848 [Pholiota conissans]|uniref:Uncharacterized protein n=1 Tax=Pholiota conissans TaxID=109636 RepID=A0A9P5YP92_9AGAR|nr:hypothetical protein BDN70DRAFT_422848 [Pholiota conissans]